MSTCFDHSRCSLTSGFPVYLYDPDTTSVVSAGYDIDGFLKTTIKQTLGYNAHLTTDPKKACVFLVLVGEALSEHEVQKSNRYVAPQGAADGSGAPNLSGPSCVALRAIACADRSGAA